MGPRSGNISLQSWTLWTLCLLCCPGRLFVVSKSRGSAVRRRGFTFGCSGDKTCFVLRRVTRWGRGLQWLTDHVFCVCVPRETEVSQTRTDALKVLACAIGFKLCIEPPPLFLPDPAFSSFPHSFSIRELTAPLWAQELRTITLQLFAAMLLSISTLSSPLPLLYIATSPPTLLFHIHPYLIWLQVA